jgi:ClpP class serine protease
MSKKRDPERAAFFQREAQLIRAARELMEVYGSQAAAVAEKRALHLDECGEIATAMTWREIADAVRTIEAKDPSRRSGRSP